MLTIKKTDKVSIKFVGNTSGYDGHCLRAYGYYKDQMPDITKEIEEHPENQVEIINSIKDRYKAINESERLHEQALQEALAPNTITSIYSKKSTTGGSSIKRDHAKEVSKDNKLEIDKGIINKDKEDQLDYSDFEKDKTSNDGLIDSNKEKLDNADPEKIKLKIPGSVIKELERYHIIPLYIDDLCLGYYYLEFKENDQYTMNTQLADPVIALKANTKLYNEKNSLFLK